MGEALELRRDRRHHLRVPVSVIEHADAAREVDIAFTLDVVDIAFTLDVPDFGILGARREHGGGVRDVPRSSRSSAFVDMAHPPHRYSLQHSEAAGDGHPACVTAQDSTNAQESE